MIYGQNMHQYFSLPSGYPEKDSYLLNGQEYQMPQHGFAGDQLFDVVSKTVGNLWHFH